MSSDFGVKYDSDMFSWGSPGNRQDRVQSETLWALGLRPLCRSGRWPDLVRDWLALSPSLFHSFPMCQLAIPGQESVSVDWAERAGSGLKQSCWSWAHHFFQISLGKKEREREREHIPASRAANTLHTHTTRFFCKGEPWMRLTKGSCKSPSWPPSMSTALGVKGRTNYIHSQQTPLLYNTSCPSLAAAERTDRKRERERKVEFFLFH